MIKQFGNTGLQLCNKNWHDDNCY